MKPKKYYRASDLLYFLVFCTRSLKPSHHTHLYLPFLAAHGCLKGMVKGPKTVAQVWNPSFSGGRDQEDPSLRPAEAKSSQGPIATNKS
jgi:hypothetical protein